MKLLLLLPVLLFASCSPSFGGGGFIAPLLTGIGFLVFGWYTVKSKVYHPFRNGYALFCYACGLATIGIVIAMASAK